MALIEPWIIWSLGEVFFIGLFLLFLLKIYCICFIIFTLYAFAIPLSFLRPSLLISIRKWLLGLMSLGTCFDCSCDLVCVWVSKHAYIYVFRYLDIYCPVQRNRKESNKIWSLTQEDIKDKDLETVQVTGTRCKWRFSNIVKNAKSRGKSLLLWLAKWKYCKQKQTKNSLLF